MKKITLFFMLVNLMSCAPKVKDQVVSEGPSAPKTYRTANVEGAIDGHPWQFVSGIARPSKLGNGMFDFSLFSQEFEDPCSTWNSYQSRVFTTVPIGIGEYKFGEGNPAMTATLYYQDSEGGMNLIVTEGSLKVTAITDERIEGSILIDLDSRNNMNGSFRIKVCK